MRKLLSLLLVSALSTSLSQAQQVDSLYLAKHFDLKEYHVPMRDGAELFTVVYTPKDTSVDYPILMNRTCYNASGYTNFQFSGYPSDFIVRDGYIFVFQDVRGRYMSDGSFDNMRPNIPGNDVRDKDAVDESSDTYDTIEWLLNNIDNNNGKAPSLLRRSCP